MTHTKWLLIIAVISLATVASSEFLINTIPAASSLRLKSIPGMAGLVMFLFLFSTYAYKNRPKLLPASLVFIAGLLLLAFVGIPLWLIVGCSTGAVCV